MDDTSVAVGSEAYAAALQVYNYAKVSGQGEGLDIVVGLCYTSELEILT